jgi:hypothetical protein
VAIVDEQNGRTRLQDSHNPEDERRILGSASKALGVDESELVLVNDAQGLLVKRVTTQEYWQVQKLNSLPKIEPAN